MKCTITLHSPEYTDYDGFVHEATTKTFECPFEVGEKVYYAYPEIRLFRKDRWVVQKSRICDVWATNIFGVCLDGGNHVHEDWFYRIFRNKEDAIEFCLKRNNQLKVKVYE